MMSFNLSIPVFYILINLLALGHSNKRSVECTPPLSGDWEITTDCTLSKSVRVPRNVIVSNNATLTILNGVDLNIDLTKFRLEVKKGSNVVIKKGGKVLTYIIDKTDDRIGYYLKEVNGPVLRAYRENTPFYPASTIKVLEHLYTIRAFEAGSVSLTTTFIDVCPGVNCSCSGNLNTDCSSPNSCESCSGGCPNSTRLDQVLQNMMIPSSNTAPNALQEFFGDGDASVGRRLMNQTANNIVGMSDNTALIHKFGCGNVAHDPFNTSTLADLGLLYEEVSQNNNVLNSQRVAFYQNMLHETNDGSFLTQITRVITQENIGVGLSDIELQSFISSIRTARKPGGVGCCRSVAGWISLPVNNGTNNIEFVFGLFIDEFTVINDNGGDNESISLNREVAELLRPEIKNAMKTW